MHVRRILHASCIREGSQGKLIILGKSGKLFLFVSFMFDLVAIREEEIRDGNNTSINHLTMDSEKQRMQRLKSCE